MDTVPAKSVRIYSVENIESLNTLNEILFGYIDSMTTDNGTILTTSIDEINLLNNDVLYGKLKYDEEQFFITKGGEIYLAIENEAEFAFCGINCLLIYTNQIIAERIAYMLNNIVFGSRLGILNRYLTEDQILTFLRTNTHKTSNAFLRALVSPGANRTSIFGPDVDISEQYERALELGGEHSFVRVRLLPENMSIGLSRKGIVIFYSKIDNLDIIDFMREKIFPLF